MNEIFIGSTAEIIESPIIYRGRSNSAPPWLTEPGQNIEEFNNELFENVEEKYTDNQVYYTYKSDAINSNKLTWVIITSYLIVMFMIISSIYALGCIIVEINTNPKLNIFLASWIFTSTFGMLTITTVCISDLSEEIANIIQGFTISKTNTEKKNI